MYLTNPDLKGNYINYKREFPLPKLSTYFVHVQFVLAELLTFCTMSCHTEKYMYILHPTSTLLNGHTIIIIISHVH